MLGLIILLLFGLTIFGYVQIQIPGVEFLKSVMLVINGHSITLLNFLVFGLILWALGVLPSPFRQIAGGLLVLWILSILGIIAIVWSGQFVLVAMVVLLFLAIIMGN